MAESVNTTTERALTSQKNGAGSGTVKVHRSLSLYLLPLTQRPRRRQVFRARLFGQDARAGQCQGMLGVFGHSILCSLGMLIPTYAPENGCWLFPARVLRDCPTCPPTTKSVRSPAISPVADVFTNPAPPPAATHSTSSSANKLLPPINLDDDESEKGINFDDQSLVVVERSPHAHTH